MEQNEIKNCCENCKHFYQHYVKGEHNLIKTGLGHCSLNTYKNNRIRVRFDVCEFWEAHEISQKELRRRNIKQAIIDISFRLDEFL